MDEACPHCVRTSFAFAYPLYDTKNFHIICDVHPLKEGHLHWKLMRENTSLMETSRSENLRCTEKFTIWKSRR